MAIQWTTPAETTSPVEYRYQPSLRQQPVPVPRGGTTVAEQIGHLANDYQRAVFCREHAETFRRLWFAGKQRELDYVIDRADEGDPRFKNMTYAQLETTARWRWSQSARGQHFMTLEKVFTGWAQMYLSFAEVEVLNQRSMPPH